MVRSLFRAAAASVVATASLAGQQPATRALVKPDAEFQESFDAVTALRELGNGRVLLTDLGPKTVILADFKTGEQVTIGRNGQGPGEYQFPGELLGGAGDTTLVADRVSRRLLLIGPDGKLGKTLPYPDVIQGMAEPRGADRQGRIYFQASPFRGGPGDDGPDGRALPDSTAVLRWDRNSNKVDTVTRVKIPSLKMQVTNRQNARMVLMRPQPYAAADEWAVAGDGRVAVARVGDYHVEWLGGARPARGAPVSYDRVKVVAADKDAFIAGMKNSRNRLVINNGGPGRGEEMKPPEPTADEFEWPEYKPPFRSGGQRAAFTSPEGQLWLTRSTSARDSTPVFDVFDASGALTGRVSLPAGRRLVGLGRGTLYAVRTDADGLQWLERYKRD